MRRGLRIARVAGIDIVADASVIVLAVLLTWSFQADFRRAMPDLNSQVATAWAAAGGLLFVGGIVVHELSHSVVARRRGLVVTRIRLFVFGGASEIETQPKTPFGELVVAAAGPAASLVLAVGFGALAIASPDGWQPFGRLMQVLAYVNAALAVFNMLPGLPLDGGRVLRALVWRTTGSPERATRAGVSAGRAVGFLVAAIGLALVLTGDLFGIWAVGVGWFLFQAATAVRAREEIMKRVQDLTIGEVMRSVELAVPGDLTVAELFEKHVFGQRLRTLPVEVDQRVRGVIGDREVAPLGVDERRVRTVASVMTPIGRGDVVSIKTPLSDLLTREGGRTGRAVVVENDRVVGIVEGAELDRILRSE